MLRSAFTRITCLSLLAPIAGCLSTPPAAPISDDASLDFDAYVPPTSDDSGTDAAQPDATLPTDSGSIVDATLPPTDAADAAPPDASLDSSVADAADATPAADAADAAGPVDAGPDAAGAITSSTLQLNYARQGANATLLSDGRVLFTGGFGSGAGSNAEIFDPVANTITVTPNAPVVTQSGAAVLLPTGQVLIVGGAAVGDAGVDRTAQIFDPTTGLFTLVSNLMVVARSGPAAALITTGTNAGKVLIAGGYAEDPSYDSGIPGGYPSLNSAEIFDPGANPATGTFTAVPTNLSVNRGGGITATALSAGSVLVAGGAYGPNPPIYYQNTADLLDPTLTTFAPTTGVMGEERIDHTATTLGDGTVLLAGGIGTPGGGVGSAGYDTTADVYYPATGTFASIPLPGPRAYQAAVLLPSGRVFLIGGSSLAGYLGDGVLYDPTTKTFSEAGGTLSPPRALVAATLLHDGRVMVVGGQSSTGIVGAVDFFSE